MVDIVTGELHPGPIRHRFPYQDQKRLLNEARSNFVVALFTGRTGSTFVQNSLNQHPDIEFNGEFLAKVVKDENAAVLQEQLVGKFFARRDKKIHVFKTKIQDIKNLEVLRQNILSHDCIVIHSYRTNVVKQCISGMQPRKLLEETETNFGLRLPRNLIAKSVASGIKPLGKMIIEKRRLDGALSYFSKNAETLRKFLESLRDVHVIEMAYEDLNEHKALVLNSLIAYMGLRPIEWEETILKHTSDSLRDVIENFDELAEMYRGTPYYEMFFDGDVARPKMVEPTQSEPVSIAPNVPSIAPDNLGIAPDDQGSIGQLQTRIEQINAKFEAINRRILKVNKGDFEAFVYQGDISANLTPNRKLLPQAPLNARQFVNRWNKSKDIVSLLIAWYAAEQIPTAFLDIGSNIGTDSIRIAKFSRLIDARFPITAFEPGVNAALVPHNLRLNEVDDIVDFEEKCMSDNSKPVVLFGEAGMSVNNRMVNRRPATESFSKIVNCTSVSKHLSADKFSGRHPVMKIDTQGAEWFIWNGMKQEISRRYFTMVMDMSPWALSTSVSPGTFLSEVLQSFHLYDLGNTRQQFVELTMTNLEESIAAIKQRTKPRWTDLLCVSRTLPSSQRLIERIAAAYA